MNKLISSLARMTAYCRFGPRTTSIGNDYDGPLMDGSVCNCSYIDDCNRQAIGHRPQQIKSLLGLSSDSNSGLQGGEVVKVVYFRPFENYAQAKSFLTHEAPSHCSLSQAVAL